MASRSPEDDPLVALRMGDALPFEEFVRAWTGTLTAFFVRQGASLSRAEDLTQDVFIKLYRSAASYQPRERFMAFCFRTARNAWIDDCRRSAARAGPTSVHDADSELEQTSGTAFGKALGAGFAAGFVAQGDPCASLLREEEERSLCCLLDELPSGQRRVFELALLSELTYGEISSLLSIPVGTVKSRMFHAVRRLRLAWEKKREREGVA